MALRHFSTQIATPYSCRSRITRPPLQFPWPLSAVARSADVGVAERADQLRHRDAIGLELFQIRLDVEFLGCAPQRVDGDNTRNREQAAGDDPVLDRAEIGQPEMRRADDLVAVKSGWPWSPPDFLYTRLS
jgi:hypothetical protein